ncbi:MAG: site-specific integrase [Clostridia bacterium]|nr:site-specific integrase [Clostridia bacterium]
MNVTKRGNVYQYQFEIAKINGKRQRISKSGFKTRKEAVEAGVKAEAEYINTGHSFTPEIMSYSDYLDFWLENYCHVNLKYHTIQAYENIIKNHVKPGIGFYRLNQITISTLQEFVNGIYVNKGFSKNFMKNILKVIKGSFNYALDKEMIKNNPALRVKLPKYDIPPEDPAHIFTDNEIEKILNRFKKNHCMYYAIMTAYFTGLRVSEVFALTWNDIDFEKKTLTVNKNIIKKNQLGTTKQRHLSGNSTTVWYFGTCKTESSYRTIPIGDTLVEALKKYKQEQEQDRKDYGDLYMKHYRKITENYYNKKPEIKIVNAYSEIDVALDEVPLVFVKRNGVFEGTDTCKYPFKVIHYELGINCRFHDFRDTHATKLIEGGADIKAVSQRLGHSNIKTTYEIYVRVTNKMQNALASDFEELVKVK